MTVGECYKKAGFFTMEHLQQAGIDELLFVPGVSPEVGSIIINALNIINSALELEAEDE